MGSARSPAFILVALAVVTVAFVVTWPFAGTANAWFRPLPFKQPKAVASHIAKKMGTGATCQPMNKYTVRCMVSYREAGRMLRVASLFQKLNARTLVQLTGGASNMTYTASYFGLERL